MANPYQKIPDQTPYGAPQVHQQSGQPQYGGVYDPNPYNVRPPTTYQTMPPAPVMVTTHFRDHPQRHLCQFCGVEGSTEVAYTSGVLTVLVAGGICLVGFWLGCCLIPFCVDELKDVEHFCPACRHMVGKFRRV